MYKECVILTLSRVILQKIVFVRFSFEENREEFFDADVNHMSADMDLVIVLPRITF